MDNKMAIAKCECGTYIETSSFWVRYMKEVGRTDFCGEH
jgi:hypothetical protein